MRFHNAQSVRTAYAAFGTGLFLFAVIFGCAFAAGLLQ